MSFRAWSWKSTSSSGCSNPTRSSALPGRMRRRPGSRGCGRKPGGRAAAGDADRQSERHRSDTPRWMTKKPRERRACYERSSLLPARSIGAGSSWVSLKAVRSSMMARNRSRSTPRRAKASLRAFLASIWFRRERRISPRSSPTRRTPNSPGCRWKTLERQGYKVRFINAGPLYGYPSESFNLNTRLLEIAARPRLRPLVWEAAYDAASYLVPVDPESRASLDRSGRADRVSRSTTRSPPFIPRRAGPARRAGCGTSSGAAARRSRTICWCGRAMAACRRIPACAA